MHAAVWQASTALHAVVTVWVQTPVWQASVPLQGLPSSHDAPLASAVCTQPCDGEHATEWQLSTAAQDSGVPWVQTPALQVSLPLHTFASSHELPVSAVCTQPCAGTQAAEWHTSEATQLGAPAWVQTPALQVSAPLQALPSSHELPDSAVWMQPWVGEHAAE
jgi:hypothetical protein